MNALALEPTTKRQLDHLRALATRAALVGSAWTTKTAAQRARKELAEIIEVARQLRRELPR